MCFRTKKWLEKAYRFFSWLVGLSCYWSCRWIPPWQKVWLISLNCPVRPVMFRHDFFFHNCQLPHLKVIKTTWILLKLRSTYALSTFSIDVSVQGCKHWDSLRKISIMILLLTIYFTQDTTMYTTDQQRWVWNFLYYPSQIEGAVLLMGDSLFAVRGVFHLLLHNSKV